MPAEPEQAPPPAPAHEAAAGGKKKMKKGKKQFVPLPTLEAAADRLPFSIAFSQRMGRHAVAKRDLQPGELVLRELPVATVVRPQFQAEVCHGCLQPLQPGQAAVSDGFHAFCSSACDGNASAGARAGELHAQISQIAAETDVEETLLRFVVALHALPPPAEGGGSPADDAANGNSSPAAAATSNGAAAAEGELPLLRCGRADVLALAAHWEQQHPEWRRVVSDACQRLREALLTSSAGPEPPSVQKLQELAAIVSQNSHGLAGANESNTDLAVGLFPALSMLNHSCRPNVCFAAAGREMQVRAVRPVVAGEQLCVAYVGLTEDRATRRLQLQASKHFACACARCSEPLETSVDRFLEGLACSAAGCPGPMVCSTRGQEAGSEQLIDQEWRCCACGKTDAEGGREAAVAQLRADWQRAMLMPRNSPAAVAANRQVLEAVLAASPSKLHPLHAVAIDCLMPLVNACRAQGDTQAALQHLTRLQAALATVEGCPSPEQGNLAQLQARLLEQRARSVPPALASRLLKQAREALSTAIQLWTVTLGEKHPFVVAAGPRLRLLR